MTMLAAIVASALALLVFLIGVCSLYNICWKGVVIWGDNKWPSKEHPFRAAILISIDLLCVWGGIDIIWSVWF